MAGVGKRMQVRRQFRVVIRFHDGHIAEYARFFYEDVAREEAVRLSSMNYGAWVEKCVDGAWAPLA